MSNTNKGKKDKGPSPVPRDVHASHAEGTKLRLTWTTPTDNAHADFTNCCVEKSTNDEDWDELDEERYLSIQPTYVEVECTEGELCRYKVSVKYNGKKWSESSQPTRQYRLPGEPPGCPGSVYACGFYELCVTWQPPTDEGDSPITHYRVQYRKNGGQWLEFAERDFEKPLAKGLTGHFDPKYHMKTYMTSKVQFRVTAHNLAGPSDFSDTALLAKGNPFVEENRRTIFSKFLRSGQHGAAKYRAYHDFVIVMRLETPGSDRIKMIPPNEGQWSVEELMLKELESQNEMGEKIIIFIFMSHSPSPRCSRKLLELIDQSKNMILHIHTAGLHKVFRQSCKNDHCGIRCPFGKLEKNKECTDSLIELLSKRNVGNKFRIGPFTFEKWKALADALNGCPELANGFEQITYNEAHYKTMFDDMNDGWLYMIRSDEDLRMKSDYQSLLTIYWEKARGQDNTGSWEPRSLLLEHGAKTRIFNRFLKSGLHGYKQIGVVIIAEVTDPDTDKTLLNCVFEHESEQSYIHAEDKLISGLNKIQSCSQQRSNLCLKIFTSYSPCQGCSKKYEQFKGSDLGQKMKIVIRYAGLFNAHRESCPECNHKRRTDEKREQYFKPCTEGMQNLIRHDGIAIRPFSEYNDWLKLVDVLNRCPDYEDEECIKYTKEQYEGDIPPHSHYLMHENKRCNRSEEDKLQLSDFEALPRIELIEDTETSDEEED